MIAFPLGRENQACSFGVEDDFVCEGLVRVPAP